MEETLIIKNFGPIELVELKLKRFTILIGEQATGKSTVAKVLAVCRYFSYIVGSDFSLDSSEFESGLAAWGLKEFIKEDSFISYNCYHYSLEVTQEIVEEISADFDGKIEYKRNKLVLKTQLKSHSPQFKRLMNEYEKIKPDDENYGSFSWRIPTSFFQNDVASVMDNPFYLPTERGLQSVFSLGKNSIQNISDSLFNQFAKLDQIARFFKEDTLIEPLDITYRNENGRGYIKKRTDKNFYSLYNGATSYQSTIPTVLSIGYYSKLRKKSKTFILEEPELGLFPVAQNEVMKYLVRETVAYNHQILLTTHSPYIITSLNNFLYAYKIGQKHGEVSDIVEKKYWLDANEVTAYRLFPDGTAKNIIDDELKQIDAGEIDEASTDTNQIWDKISDIRFSSVNEI